MINGTKVLKGDRSYRFLNLWGVHRFFDSTGVHRFFDSTGVPPTQRGYPHESKNRCGGTPRSSPPDATGVPPRIQKPSPPPLYHTESLIETGLYQEEGPLALPAGFPFSQSRGNTPVYLRSLTLYLLAFPLKSLNLYFVLEFFKKC
jgi:hypothetical protein